MKRPAKSVAEQAKMYDDPMEFLTSIMNNAFEDIKTRADAAKALLPYTHPKMGDGGKKEQKQAKAEKVAGRFTPSAPPKLSVVGGKRA